MISERAKTRLENRKRKFLQFEKENSEIRKEQLEREEYFKHKICPDCGGDFIEVINWSGVWRMQSQVSYQKKFRCNNCNLTFWEN